MYKVRKTSSNNRLSEMGIIKGALFRIVKKVAGMIQVKFGNSNDLVMREDVFSKVEYDKEKQSEDK